jgi:hypothetical protein
MPSPGGCDCSAARPAARHLTRCDKEFLAAMGVRTTQFSDRAILKGQAGLPIGASEFAIVFSIMGAAQLRPQAVVELAPVNRPALHASAR